MPSLNSAYKELFETYKEIIEDRYSSNTVRSYLSTIKHFLYYLQDQNSPVDKVEDMDRNFIREWKRTVRKYGLNFKNKDSGEVSDRSLARYVATIRNFFKYMYGRNIPKEVVPSYDMALPDRLELSKMHELIDTLNESVGEDKYAVRDRAIIYLAYDCALRVSEVASLDVDNLSFEGDPLLQVKGKGGKEAVIPLNENSIKYLKTYLEERGKEPGALFLSRRGSRLHPTSIEDILKKWGGKAGISEEKLHFNILRHTRGYYFRTQNMAMQEMKTYFRHEDIRSTEIYSKVSSKELIERQKEMKEEI